MFLRSITLEHVRSIEHLELNFGDYPETRKWTLILGQNGCGKSTILRSIALLTAGSDALPELLRNPEDWVRNGHSECRLSGVIETTEGETREISLTIGRDSSVSSILMLNRDSLAKLDSALKHSNRNYFTAGYGVSRRFQSGASFSQGKWFSNPRSQSIATLFSPDATLQSVDAWAAQLHYAKGDSVLNLLRQVFDQLLPGVSFREIDKTQSRVLFDTADGVIPLDRLSDGYQNVAAWCGDLVNTLITVFQNYDEPMHARGVLLVDEIDLHLHPVWQRQLRDYLSLQLPNFQIIATTHSALTAHQCGINELHCLARPSVDGPPVLRAYPGEPRKLLLHQLLLDPMFGLGTMDSLDVSRKKTQFRELRAKANRNPEESDKLSALRDELSDVPSWTGAPLIPPSVGKALRALAVDPPKLKKGSVQKTARRKK